jgi:hypothetical protein
MIIAIAAIFVCSPIPLTDRTAGQTTTVHENIPARGTESIVRAAPAESSSTSTLPNCTVTMEITYVIDSSTSCQWVNNTLDTSVGYPIVIPYELTVEGTGTVYVPSLHPVFLNSSLTVEGGVKMVFLGGSIFYLGYGSRLDILQSSSVLLNNTPLSILGGQVIVDHGSLIGNSSSPSPSAEVTAIDLDGPLSSLEVNGSLIRWVNASQPIGSVTLSGTYSALIPVQHFNATNVNMFSADNAILTNVTLGSVGNMTLGNSNQILDEVNVTSLVISGEVSGTLTISHAIVWGFFWSGARGVVASQSRFSSVASNVITAVSGSFQASDSCTFMSSLIFNDTTSSVRLENISAPSLVFNKATHADVYNWPGNTVGLAGTPSVQNITVKNNSASVQIYRYLTVIVQNAGSSVPPQSATLAIRRSDISNAPWASYHLVNGTVGLYLPTDYITSLTDTFEGSYDIKATVQGTSSSQSISFYFTGEVVTLTLSSPPSTSYTFCYLVAELVLLFVLAGATGWLIVRNRRLRPPPKKVPSEKDPEPKMDEKDTISLH